MYLSELSKTAATSSLHEIPNGNAGTLATLKIMRRLVREGKTSLRVRNLAASLVNGARQKDYVEEARILQRYVRDNIRYVRDIRNVETLHSADKIIEYNYGDCDDKSILISALLESIGHPTRLVAMGINGSEFCHVYVETKIGKAWVGVETTEPVELGWVPKGQTSRLVINN